MTKAGLVTVSEKAILEWLDFKDGVIWRVSKDRWGQIEFLIEHEDMPELYEGDAVTPISPLYQKETNAQGLTTSVSRIHPAKVSEK